MTKRLQAYRQSRDNLLTSIITNLSTDQRFAAAWLTGSYARKEADEVSDLDLNLVVADPYSDSLCRRREQVSHQTTEERLALFRRFGEPALIHENNNNAPKNGTFTFVLYSASAVMMDWTLIPQKDAQRPFLSLLLFDNTNIPVSAPQPEDSNESKKYVAEQWAFFWMMTAVTIKRIARHDGVFAAEWIEHLHGLVREVERRLNSEPRSYRRGSLSRLQPTHDKQVKSIRDLCQWMEGLKSRVTEFVGFPPASPVAEIERLLLLANE